MTDRGRTPAVGCILAALAALTACGPPAGSAAVTVTVKDSAGSPVVGAPVELRLLNDSAATALTDSAGHARLELGGGATGSGLVEVARDTAAPRPQRVYAPVLVEPGARAEITVDLDGSGMDAVRYVGSTRMERWGWAVWMYRDIAREHSARYRAHVAEGGSPADLAIDWSEVVDTLRSALADERDPEVRTALWMALLRAGLAGAELSAEDADRALDRSDPAARVWEWNAYAAPGLIGYAARLAEGVDANRGGAAAGEASAAGGGRSTAGQDIAGRRELAARRTAAFVQRLIDAQDAPDVQPLLLLAALRQANRAGRTEEAVAYYERLVEEYPETREAGLAEKDAPGRRIQVGSPVPDVALPALDSTAPPITPAELAGPATLVDFWAAWCVPCVAEMPVIHAAYERFADRGFDVVSVSYDAYRDDVHAFREQYPMPWRHAFVGADSLSTGRVATAWGVTGLPAAFLVGPDGTIIALERELRGEALAETLERELGGPSP